MSWRQIICGLVAVSVLLIVIGGVARAADATQDDRLPVPDKAALEKARQLLKDVFKDDYAQIRMPGVKPQLIDKLIEQSEATRDDPVSSFAMLQEAGDLAADAGDPLRAQRSAEALAERFSVDSLELLAASFERMAQKFFPTETRKSIAEAAMRLTDEALDSRRFELATRLADACMVLAQGQRCWCAETRGRSWFARPRHERLGRRRNMPPLRWRLRRTTRRQILRSESTFAS